MNKKVGVLGGMGPLASAEFLATLYRLNVAEREQDAPRCVLLSDPSFPDRTEAILSGSIGELTSRLEAALTELLGCGADRIVIACMTIHHVLPRIPPPLRERVISLVDLMVDGILAEPRRRLLLSTIATRRVGLFESHERWGDIAPWVVCPGEEDQHAVHEWIYRLKAGLPAEACLTWLDGIARRYRVGGLLFGCTEFHLLQRRVLAACGTEWDVIDPLWIAARELRNLLECDPHVRDPWHLRSAVER